MITMTEGKPGEGMSWKSLLRIVRTHLRKRHCPLSPAQVQKVLNAVLHAWYEQPQNRHVHRLESVRNAVKVFA